VKIHDAKDPAESLGPMFRQVIGTLFSLMEQNVDHWRSVRGSKPVPTFGPESFPEPAPVQANLDRLIEEFNLGFEQFGVMWKKVFCRECYNEITQWTQVTPQSFMIPVEAWVKILYELAVAFHHWKANRQILISMMVPLYFARVASFVNQSKDMDSRGAEALVEEQALVFERNKDYLVALWDGEAGTPEA
jgi:hypothetical protein